MTSDRYMEVVDTVFAAILEHVSHDFSGDDPLRTRLHQILRTDAVKAAKRSHCDRVGHEPLSIAPYRFMRADQNIILHRVACDHCGVELKEVEP